MPSEESLYCGDCNKPATWIRSTQFAGDHPFCDDCAKKQTDFGQSDSTFVWVEISPEKVAPPKAREYRVDKSASAQRFYVGRESGENAACSAREDVCIYIANMLNSLPPEISPEDIIKAFGGGKPYGNLTLPDGDEKQQFIDKMTMDLAALGVYPRPRRRY